MPKRAVLTTIIGRARIVAGPYILIIVAVGIAPQLVVAWAVAFFHVRGGLNVGACHAHTIIPFFVLVFSCCGGTALAHLHMRARPALLPKTDVRSH